MPPRLSDTDHAMVISRKARCSVLGCGRFASYDVSMPTGAGTMGDWVPMCYSCARAATQGAFKR